MSQEHSRKSLRAALGVAVRLGEAGRSERLERSVARVLEQGFWLPTTRTTAASVLRLDRGLTLVPALSGRGE